VALKDFNDAEIPDMLKWAHGQGMDMTVIETMPMGEIEEDRTDQYMPLSMLSEQPRQTVHARGHPVPHRRPGPLCRQSRRRAASSASSPR
jgi:cyclic pyranopterin phosphate synthase